MDKKVSIPEIKIDCFTIQILKHKGRGKKSNKERIPILFKDFNKMLISSDDEESSDEKSFVTFFKEYIKSFGGKFAVYHTGKALHLNSDKVRFHSQNGIISGTFEGGTTNIGGFVKEKNKAEDNDSFILTPDHVEGQPYYFILYFPEDSNTGILLVQGFSSKSCTDIFKRHLQTFFSKNTQNVSLSFNTIVPKEFVENFRENGVIDQVTIRKQNLDSDVTSRIFGIEFEAEDGITIELRVKGLKQLYDTKDFLSKMMNGDNTKFFDIPELNNLGFDGTHETIFEYEHNGKKSSVKASKKFNLTPTFYVKELDIERDEKHLPTYKALDSYCRSLLLSLCKETSIPTPNVT